MQKINISWDDWYDAYLAYKRCMDKDYKEEGDNNYDYAEAKKILEATVLNPHIIVDDELVGTSFDIIIDYAMCCVWCRDSEKALELAKMVQKYLHLEEIAFKKGTDTKAYTYTEESQRKMWIKLCKVYANCKKEESVEYLISAIDTMKSENVNVGAEFYRMIALACGRSGKYELALKYWEQALDLADSVLKGQMQRTDYPIFWQERMKAQDSRISYSKFWTREGRKLEPGMIIGTYLDEIDVNNNPHLVEVRDRGKGTSHVKIEIINFVIWKIERGMVYAFPLKVAKGRDLEVKSPVSIGDKQYVLSRDLCQIPADSTVIKDVCGTVGEELQQLLADVYRDIAVTPLDKRSTSKYIHKFMQEVTNERMVEKAKKGDRLILDDRKSCYYIVDLDEATKDYIVVPVTYKYDIRADVYLEYHLIVLVFRLFFPKHKKIKN